jgi:hypothetical protein
MHKLQTVFPSVKAQETDLVENEGAFRDELVKAYGRILLAKAPVFDEVGRTLSAVL